MLTPTESARIHRALAEAQGDRNAAATALGMTRDKLDADVRSTPQLASLWNTKQGEPTAGQAYDRDRPAASAFDLVDEAPISPRDAALSTAFFEQSTKLQKFDWEGIGVKEGKTLQLMRSFEGNGVGSGVLRMMDAMQGGMAFCFAQVSRQFADVAEALEIEMAKESDGQGTEKRDDGRIMFLHSRFTDLAKLMQTFNKEAVNAAHTRLLIADRAKKIQQGANRMKKPTLRRVNPVNAGGARA